MPMGAAKVGCRGCREADWRTWQAAAQGSGSPTIGASWTNGSRVRNREGPLGGAFRPDASDVGGSGRDVLGGRPSRPRQAGTARRYAIDSLMRPPFVVVGGLRLTNWPKIPSLSWTRKRGGERLPRGTDAAPNAQTGEGATTALRRGRLKEHLHAVDLSAPDHLGVGSPNGVPFDLD
jgi:hypothetical protein